jgi:integrase
MHRAARVAGLSLNALDSIRYRYPEVWQDLLDAARRRCEALIDAAPIVAAQQEPENDRGLTPATRKKIRDATAILICGATVGEAAGEMQVSESAVHFWRSSYPGYWRTALAQALAIARRIVRLLDKSGAAPPDPAAFLKLVAAGDRWRGVASRAAAIAAPDPNKPLSGAMTLPEFYAAYYRLILEARGARTGTFDGYETALRLWAKYSGNPALKDVDQRTCAAFVAGVTKRRGKSGEPISPNTIRKACCELQGILDKAGPRGRHNRLGAGLVADVPYIERPRSRPKLPTDLFTLAEIGQWLGACHVAKLPELPNVAARTWWSALVRFLWNSGVRIGSALALEWRMIQPIDGQPGAYANLPGDCYKGGNPHRIYLNAAALAAAEEVRPCGSVKLFPWNYTATCLQRSRKSLLTGAGIPRERQFGFHGLRKALATELAPRNALLAQQQLGHAAMAVTRQHYVDPIAVASVMENLPQPVAVESGHQSVVSGQ